jgi:hypothetical protein
MFSDVIHRPVFYLKQRFGDWSLSPSTGKNLLSWAKLTELVLISGLRTPSTTQDRVYKPTTP